MIRHQCLLLFSAAFLFLLLVSFRRSQAAWTVDGNPVCTAIGVQDAPVAMTDGEGGAYVLWLDHRVATPRFYLQRILPDGSIGGAWLTNGNQFSSTTGTQVSADMTGDGSGGVYVAWEELGSVRVQRMDPSGSVHAGWPAGGIIVSTLAGSNGHPKVMGDGSNGAIIVWANNPNFGSLDYLASQRVNGSGQKLWGGGTEVSLSAYASHSTNDLTQLVFDTHGGAFVIWHPLDNVNDVTLRNIAAQHVTSSGQIAAGWPSNGNVICNQPGDQIYAKAIPDGAGGFYAAWTDWRVSNQVQAAALRVDASGIRVAGWTQNGTLFAQAWLNALVSGGADGIIVLLNSSGVGREARRLNGNGSLSWLTPAWTSTVTQSGTPDLPMVESGTEGAIMAARRWPSNNLNDGDAVAQLITRNGHIAFPLVGLPVSQALLAQTPKAMVMSSSETAIVFFVDERHGTSNPDIYAMMFGGRSNVDAASGFAPYWDSPVVPRNYAGGNVTDVHVSPTLDGNVNGTFFNSVMWQNGPFATPSWIWRVTLDSEVLLDAPTPDSMAVGGYAFLDAGPVVVRGGRHTMGHLADPSSLFPESNESDNAYEGQWVWSPMVLDAGAPLFRTAPPERSVFPNPSGDGFQSSRNTYYSWVISMAPLSANDDYDLYVYDDYSSSTSGFSNLRKASLYAWDGTDFVVGHWAGTPTTLYSQAVRYAIGFGDGFSFDQIDANGRSAGETANFQNQLMDTWRLTDVYEAYLTAGHTYHFTLNRFSGGSDLGITIYPATYGQIYSRADGLNTPGAAIGQSVGTTSDVIASYNASITGYYPIVVYRLSGDQAEDVVSYSLSWGTGAVTAVNSDGTTKQFMFSGAIPNPVRSRAVFEFSLPETAPVRLALYDLNGRLVRDIAHDTRPAGEQRLAWDGTADDGAPVGNGIYFARLEAMGHVLSRRVVMIH